MRFKIGNMKEKITINDNQQKDLSHLMTKPFTEDEKSVIATARKKVGVDRPIFYHDAILSYAKKINMEADNA